MAEPREPFFVGWATPPSGLRGFLVWVAGGLVGLFAALGYLLAATQDDPGDGAFRFDWNRQTVVGVLERKTQDSSWSARLQWVPKPSQTRLFTARLATAGLRNS